VPTENFGLPVPEPNGNHVREFDVPGLNAKRTVLEAESSRTSSVLLRSTKPAMNSWSVEPYVVTSTSFADWLTSSWRPCPATVSVPNFTTISLPVYFAIVLTSYIVELMIQVLSYSVDGLTFLV
jgi:hypothetical protein